jgi:hypothetical protein
MFCEKKRGSPENCREMFPRRSKERGSAALTMSVSNKIFSFLLQVLIETYVKKL